MVGMQVKWKEKRKGIKNCDKKGRILIRNEEFLDFRRKFEENLER